MMSLPLDESAPAEERIQRPERPQRANRPPGNSSPLQPYNLRAHISDGQNASGREELPRPNAPVQDENYNNRSVSPLFASHSSSLPVDSTHRSHRVLPGNQLSPTTTSHVCESHPTRPQMIDLEYSESQPSTSSNSHEFRGFTPGDIINHPLRDELYEQIRNHSGWPLGRNVFRNNNIRAEDQPGQSNSVTTARRAERYRPSRRRNYRDETQPETSSGSRRSSVHWERDRHTRYGPSWYLEGMSPSQLRNANWGLLGLNSGLVWRSTTRRPLHNSDDNQDGANSNNIADTEINWTSENQVLEEPNVTTSQINNNSQNVERRASWEEGINVMDDEEEGLLQQQQHEEEEDENDDSGVLITVSPEHHCNGRAGETNSAPRTTAETAESGSRASSEHAASSNSSLTLRNTDVTQLVLSALECPVCFDYLAPPITQCYEGHLLCQKCRMRLSHCPECRGGFSSVRPRAVERITNYLEYPCSYEGCTQLVSSANRILHAKTCSLRSFVCPIVSNCPWTGKKMYMKDHVINFHGSRFLWVNRPSLTFTIEPQLGKEKVYVMEAMDNLFLIKFTVAPRDKLRGCVTLLGDLSRIQKINVVVLVQSLERPCPCLMISRTPAVERDEMDMRLEKFAVFNINQLISVSSITPSPLKVKVAVGKKDILKQLDHLFE